MGMSLNSADLYRLAGCQAYCSNLPSETPEDFYHITLYCEFLSDIAAELEEKQSIS